MEELDIDVKQGSTFSLAITYYAPDGVTPIDLTGYTFRGQIRKNYSDAEVQADFSFNETDLANGEFEAVLTAAETTGIEVPETDKPHRKIAVMIYDIEIVSAGGEVTRILQGLANISPEVTR